MFSCFERAGRNDADNIVTALTTVTTGRNATMAAIHIVQLAHLSQELIGHIIQAHNQLARAKVELDRIMANALKIVNHY
jgi:hypothetical protein